MNLLNYIPGKIRNLNLIIDRYIHESNRGIQNDAYHGHESAHDDVIKL